MHTSIFVIFHLLLISVLSYPDPGTLEKSVVRYLGTPFILKDGCPEPNCKETSSKVDEACEKAVNTIRALYSHCVQSAEGQELGCVTDRIKNGTEEITVPLYANKCSAMCYESDPANLARVIACPHHGDRQYDPDLKGLF